MSENWWTYVIERMSRARRGRAAPGPRRPACCRPQVEPLEVRLAPAVTAVFTPQPASPQFGALTVTGDEKANDIRVERNVNGNIAVTDGGNPVAIMNSKTKMVVTLTPNQVTELTVSGLGDKDTLSIRTLTGLPPNATRVLDGGDDDDTLIGSDRNDKLIGGKGKDTLEGFGGSDELIGGPGDDTYEFNNANPFFGPGDFGTDTVVEAAGGGADTLDFSGFTVPEDKGVTLALSSGPNATVLDTKILKVILRDPNQIERIKGTEHKDMFEFRNYTGTVAIDGGERLDIVEVAKGPLSASQLQLTNVEVVQVNDANAKLAVNANLSTGIVNVKEGKLELGAGTLTVSNGVLVRDKGVVIGSGAVQGDLSNSGQVSPGGDGAVGKITVTGKYTQNGGGKLLIDLIDAAKFDQVVVGGKVELKGTLTVNDSPGLKGEFKIIDNTGNNKVTGKFDNANKENASVKGANGTAFRITYEGGDAKKNDVVLSVDRMGASNTGIGGDGNPLPLGAPDPRWLVTLPSGATITPVAYTDPAYLPNSPESSWLSLSSDTDRIDPVGVYVWRTTIVIPPDINPARLTIKGRWSSDNQGLDIRVNGVSTGHSHDDLFAYTQWSEFTLTGPFRTGVNTIEFVVFNSPELGFPRNPTSLRVEFTEFLLT